MKAWLGKRLPPAHRVTLDHSRLFVFPTRAGLGFLVILLGLWLLGTNYENNVILGLTFLLLGLFVVVPLHTFSNLSGVTVALRGTQPAFAGEHAVANLRIERRGKQPRERIGLYWPGEVPVEVDLLEKGSTEFQLALPVLERGLVSAPRVCIESSFPLGIFRCWSHLDLDAKFLVYPRPLPAGPLPVGVASGEGKEKSTIAGMDDFAGLKNFQPGHPLKQVAWKQYARGRELYSKEFESYRDERLWLDWDYLPGRDVETRLSLLCDWALQAHRQQLAFGLRIPNKLIEPDKGRAHLNKILEALARFPVRGARDPLGQGGAA
ncbi:DUF58 domain-containing protein [Biformimicrobium ophioploci]|uniref:DUF58 domain-containing protein n=1 Tax=Biformimicrobium ophioploci TaxID=3036711 RepID=A0ABQ6LZE0_9GAMM|nr:DUF58 domain-containing protein [Microbulbifer sp. NKW57]